MKELDDGARVWRVFNDESERIDAELVVGWTGTLDTLFIFAGLFSAVVATFLTQTAQSLQQDYSAVTASLLTEMVMLQRATATGGNISGIPQSDLTYNSTFTSSSREIWLNSLWLASLALTLSVALVAGLIKQWLHYYLADITVTTPKVRACTRQFRYRGLIQWGVPPIIESLPVLMNTSLFLFFIGLVLFTRDLSGMVGTSWFLVGIIATSFTIYVGSSFIPIWTPQCPYKTSLSKVYNGLIKVIWHFVKQQSLEDVEDVRSSLKHYSMHFKRWITKLLIHRSSLRKMESETVIKQDFMLQQNVITEMGLNSTNPSVSAVALQSLAAFQTQEVSLQLPDSLIWKLGDLFRGYFQQNPSKEWGYSIAPDSSVGERYSRAILLFPDLISYVDNDWERLFSFSPPENLYTAVLLASALRHAIRSSLFPLPPMKENLKLVIQFVLDAPSMEVSKLIPWHHRQFIEAIELSNLYSADEQKQLLVALVKRLSLNKSLTLQEDLLIRCVYACHTAAGVIEPLKEQSLTRNHNLETSVDITRRTQATLLQFIRLLPDIADCAISLGSEEQDRLRWFLSRLYFGELSGTIHMDWDEKGASLLKDGPEHSSCVNSLIEILNRLASSWEEWNGDILIWLKVITDLYSTLRFYGGCNEEVSHVIFHWLLVLSLQCQDCARNADPIERMRMEYTLLESIFPSLQQISSMNDPKDHFIDSLKICCAFITTNQLVGLPPVIMGQLFERFRDLLNESCELPVLDWINTLFHCFIKQDPLKVDPVYSMTWADQHQTLTSIINFAHSQQFRSASWRRMLSGWRVLIIDSKASIDEKKINAVDVDTSGANLDIMNAKKIEPSIEDQWDIRDVLLISEDSNYIDPWDLRDVLWMFKMQIPFGIPLSFERLLRNLDTILGVRESSDVNRLFKDASDTPYPPPPPDNLDSET